MEEPKAVVNWDVYVELKRKNQTLFDDNADLQARVKGLQNKIFELKNRVYATEEENAKLKDNAKSLTDQITERCDKVRQLNAENEKLTADYDSITDEYWDLVEEHNKLNESYSKALTDIGALKVSLIVSDKAQYGSSTNDLEYKLKKLNGENASLRNDIACYKNKIDDLEAQAAEDRNVIDNRARKIVELTNKLNSAHYPDSRVEELESQLKASQDARVRQANQLTNQQEVLRQRSDYIAKLVDKTKKLNDEVSEWIDKYNDLKKAYDEEQKKHNWTELYDENEDLHKTVDALKEENEELHKSVDTLGCYFAKVRKIQRIILENEDNE